MLAAATLGLLGTALASVKSGGRIDTVGLLLLVIGFAAGVALLFVMDRLIPHVHAGGHHVHLHGDEVHRPSDHEEELLPPREGIRRRASRGC